MAPLLRRYTELPYVIDYLRTEQLALLNPASWDDRNDAFYIQEYARQTGAASVYALCLADGDETYHHWRVFSSGAAGACIEFKRAEFSAALAAVPGLDCRNVVYKRLDELRKAPPDPRELPFLKRRAFVHEGEFRILLSSGTQGPPIQTIPVPLTCIDRILLSPWLPKEVAAHVSATIKLLPKCSRMKVYRSTLVENEQWKKLAVPKAR